MFTALPLLAALFSAPANAHGVVVTVGVPGVHVEVNPWAPHYRPAPRAGWTWIAGHYDRFGAWAPGRWIPAYTRAGYGWVDGYWNGHVWVDGYWRAASRPGFAWVDGYYSHGRWVAGCWREAAHVAAVRAEVHADAVRTAAHTDAVRDAHQDAGERREAQAHAQARSDHAYASSSAAERDHNTGR